MWITAWLAPAALALTLACGGPEPKSGAEDTRTGHAPQVDLPEGQRRWSRPSRVRIGKVSQTETTVDFELTGEVGSLSSGDFDPLLFCVPQEGDLVLEVDLIHVRRASDTPDSPDLLNRDGGDNSAQWAQIERVGIMRRWPLAQLKLKDSRLQSALIKAYPDSATFTARMRIRWDQSGSKKNKTAPFTKEATEGSWRWIAEKMVANLKGLERFQIARPSLRADLVPSPTGPLLTEGLDDSDRRWARLRVRDEGLIALNPLDLEGAGFDPDRLDESGVRIFYRGLPVPTIHRGGPGAERIYFWNDANPSPYTRERVYWVTVAPDLPDSIAPIAPEESGPGATGAGGEGIETVSSTTRTARLDRDNEFVVARGKYMAIQGMNWLDSRLEPGKPNELSLPLPHATLQTKPMRAKIRLIFDEEFDAAQRRKSSGLLLNISHAGETIHTHKILKKRESIITMQIPPEAVEGVRSGTLKLSIRIDVKKGSAASAARLWFDWLEVDYESETRMLKGRLTLPTPSSAGAASVRRLLINAAGLDGPLQNNSLLAFARSYPNGRTGAAELIEHRASQTPDSGYEFRYRPAAGSAVDIYDLNFVPDVAAVERFENEDLTSPEQGADYLIVAHEEFLAGLGPLVQFHEAAGRRVRLVGVQSVYDAFTHGEFTPEALREFFAYTLTTWEEGAPTHILLVGDSSSDYLNVARNDVENFVPTYSYDGNLENWASDEWMTMVAGDDMLPDFLIGRLSVNSMEDLEANVAKQIHYASEYPAGQWNARVGLVCDNDLGLAAMVDRVRIAHVPDALDVRRIYLPDLPVEDNWYTTDDRRMFTFEREGRWMKVSGKGTELIYELFDEGAAIVSWFGHGSPNLWADERLWFGGGTPNSDNLHLIDSGRMSFVVNFTCNSGAIDYPIPSPAGVNVCLIEDMMRTPMGAAIAGFVPSGPGVPTRHESLAAQMFRAIFNDGAREFGAISALAKMRYWLKDGDEELPLMYILLGDPAQRLRLVEDIREFELQRETYAPGETIEENVKTGLDSGRISYGVETLSGIREFGGALDLDAKSPQIAGHARIEMSVPDTTPQGDKRLTYYAVDSATGAEIAGSAPLRVQFANHTIESVVITAHGEVDEERRYSVHYRITSGGTGLSSGDLMIASANIEKAGPPALRYEIGPSRVIEGEIFLDWATQSKPTGLRLWIRPDGPPSDLSAPRETVFDFAIPAHANSAVAGAPAEPQWVRELCRGGMNEDGSGLKVRCFATSAPDPAAQVPGVEWVSAIFEGSDRSLTMSTLDIDNLGEVLRAQTTLSFRGRGELDAEALELRLGLREPGDEGESDIRWVDRLSLADIAQDPARLRIAPGSIRTQPQSPSDGETIFVHFDVVNIGGETSRESHARLMDGHPDEGGRQVYNHMKTHGATIPPLGAGRRVASSMRWDPVDNAGERTFWIALDPSSPGTKQPPDDLYALGKVQVRTKAKLGYENFTARQNDEDRRSRTMHFVVDVTNTGETEAHNVTAGFYRGMEIKRENLIYEELVETVPANGRVMVHYPLHYDSLDDLTDAQGNSRFRVQVRLKGSQQRITSDAGATEAN